MIFIKPRYFTGGRNPSYMHIPKILCPNTDKIYLVNADKRIGLKPRLIIIDPMSKCAVDISNGCLESEIVVRISLGFTYVKTHFQIIIFKLFNFLTEIQ